jgi:modification methylase
MDLSSVRIIMKDDAKQVDVIYPKDSRKLTEFVAADSVDLTVTSPPYDNAIDYDMHSRGNRDERYRGNRIWKNLDEYLSDMSKVFEQVRQVTKIGGYCCIVIGYEIIEAEIIPLPSLLITRILNDQKSVNIDERWVMREEIIWNKVTAGRNGNGNRFGSTIRNPYPTYYHANVMHEYIFILSKGSPKIRREDAHAKMAKLAIDDEMKREIANSTWHIPPEEDYQLPPTTWTIAPVPPRSVQHPSPFPEQIPFRLITLFTKTNDTVLDPFNGSGTTTKVAKNLGCHYIGVDIIKEYCDIAEKRVNEPLRSSTRLWVKQWGSTPTDFNMQRSLNLPQGT